MTRDEAIDICLEALKEHEDGSDAWFDVMRDIAELKASKKKNPCEDTVSRKAVLNLAKDLIFDGVAGLEHYRHRCIEIEDVEDLPPVTPDLSSLREINEALTKRVKYLENMERYATPEKLLKQESLTPDTLADLLMEERIRGELKQDITYCKDIIDDVRCKLTVEIIDHRPCYCGAGLKEVWRE